MWVLQLNMRGMEDCTELLIQFLSSHAVDVLLLQDIPPGLRRGTAFRGYELYLPLQAVGADPSESDDPEVAILLRTGLVGRSLDFAHPRLCGVTVSTRRGPLALISAYIQHTSGEGLTELSSLVTLARRQTPLVLVGSDCNGHSPWWGPIEVASNALGRRIEDFILHHRLVVENGCTQGPTFEPERGGALGHTSTLRSLPLHSRALFATGGCCWTTP